MKRKPIGKRLRFQVLARDGFACHYCGRSAATCPLHVDHVLPVAKGGTNDITNLVAACADCNLGKSALVVAAAGVDFRMWLLAQAGRDDPVGDFADDEKRDHRALTEITSYRALAAQLRERGAHRGILHAAWDAWREYRRGGRPTRSIRAVHLETRRRIQEQESIVWLKGGMWSGGQFFPHDLIPL